jgi:hypothetical protein
LLPRSGGCHRGFLPTRSRSPAALAEMALPSRPNRVIDVHDRASAERRTIMPVFTINNEKEIVAFASQEEAAAHTTTPFDTFATQRELAQLATAWPPERFVAIWNSFAGVVAVKKFKNSKTAVSRIWERIQGLGEAAKPATEPEKPKVPTTAMGRAQGAHVAPAKGKATKKATPAKNAPKGKKAAKARPDALAPATLEGSKKAQVIALLQRKNGATLEEIMLAMRWQRHTVRGFMAGAMKKAGYAVESFKPKGGERTYRINAK